jgi:hypothetical protein
MESTIRERMFASWGFSESMSEGRRQRQRREYRWRRERKTWRGKREGEREYKSRDKE